MKQHKQIDKQFWNNIYEPIDHYFRYQFEHERYNGIWWYFRDAPNNYDNSLENEITYQLRNQTINKEMTNLKINQ